ncbi:hypothetical protein HID58_074096 [Brassica napus]|uniref:Uncharacterized protein n=1 Tax=Brassica napus TaxID=3708 RepID=A0ABQ7YH58_BRANA|nr:hypothetical protein HID58_074096 [Brassica napus]
MTRPKFSTSLSRLCLLTVNKHHNGRRLSKQ